MSEEHPNYRDDCADCPRCGGRSAKIEVHRSSADGRPATGEVLGEAAGCTNCGIGGPPKPTRAEAVEAWNAFVEMDLRMNQVKETQDVVVDAIETLLAAAKAGKVSGIAYVALQPSGDMASNVCWSAGAQAAMLVAGTALLHQRAMDDVTDSMAEENEEDGSEALTPPPAGPVFH